MCPKSLIDNTGYLGGLSSGLINGEDLDAEHLLRDSAMTALSAGIIKKSPLEEIIFPSAYKEGVAATDAVLAESLAKVIIDPPIELVSDLIAISIQDKKDESKQYQTTVYDSDTDSYYTVWVNN